ncbi:hypothetical protein V6N13_019767 [Hibiscus sabdariffa]
MIRLLFIPLLHPLLLLPSHLPSTVSLHLHNPDLFEEEAKNVEKAKPPSLAEVEPFGRLSLLIVVPTGERQGLQGWESFQLKELPHLVPGCALPLPLYKKITLYGRLTLHFSQWEESPYLRKGSIPYLNSTWPRKDSSFELASFTPSPLTAFPKMPFPSTKPAPSENGFTPLLNCTC